MKKLIEIKNDNIVVCDNENCDYQKDTNNKELSTFVNKHCPKCGENLLTQKDYDDFIKTKKIIDFLNKWFSWITIFIYKRNLK